MRKKSIVLIICILICFNLTGCGEFLAGTVLYQQMKSSVDSAMAAIDNVNLKEMVAYNNQYAQNKSTYNAGVKAMQTSDRVLAIQDLSTNGNIFQRVYANIAEPYVIKNASRAKEKYETYLASDQKYIKSVEAANAKGKFTSSHWREYGMLIALIVVVIVVLIVIFLKNWGKRGRQEAIMYKKENQMLQEELEARDSTDVGSVQPVTVNEEKAAIEAQQECARKGFDYNQLYAQCGSNQGVLEYCLLH